MEVVEEVEEEEEEEEEEDGQQRMEYDHVNLHLPSLSSHHATMAQTILRQLNLEIYSILP